MQSATGKTRVQVLTGDAEFERLGRPTFDAGAKIELVVAGAVGDGGQRALDADATVAVIDIDAANSDELAALQQVMLRPGRQPPVIVVLHEFNQDVVRR